MDIVMKYYRTKDGRIVKESDIPYYWGGLVAVVGLDLDYKVADNLEELFDELICDERLIARFCNVKETIKRLLSEGKTIYGAIWTTGKHGEPILKSVAKMNEKGEWELL